MPRPRPPSVGDTHTMPDGRIARVVRSSDVPDGIPRLHTTSGLSWQDFCEGWLSEDHFVTANEYREPLAIIIEGLQPAMDPNTAEVW